MDRKNIKIGIIGHFATKKYMNDGQTVKTVELYNELMKIDDFDISTVDTQDYKSELFTFIKNIYNLLRHNEYIIIVVASGGLKVLIPFLSILNIFFKKKLCYCTVGSWVDVRIKNNIFLKFFLRKMDRIFVETTVLKDNLFKLGLHNVELMYNFKKFTNRKLKIKREKNSFCIFSRILKEKGIEDAIYAINKLNKEGFKCSLGIYGPIDENYKEEFNKLLNEFPEYIKYNGSVSPEKSKEYISKYWMLLFPTHYIREGLPGTLLDAYNSNTPVIASNWASAYEFVSEDVGYIYDFADKEKLYEQIKFCIKNQNEVELKRKNTQKFMERFAPEIAIRPLIKFLRTK